MITGPLLAVFGTQRIFAHDEYVAALEHGLLVYLGSEEQFLPWIEVEHVSWNGAARTVEIARREAEPIRIVETFAKTSGERLAREVEDLRRKATFHGQ
jgi:hypothetical protein